MRGDSSRIGSPRTVTHRLCCSLSGAKSGTVALGFTAPDDVRGMIPLPGFCLAVRFHDGVAGIMDMNELVRSERAGVFRALADRAFFAEATVGNGAVVWRGELELDLAPDVMHSELRAHGEWRLR